MDKRGETGERTILGQWAQSLLTGTSDMVFLKDAQLTYIAASAPFAKMVGRNSPEEVVGKTDFELFADRSLAQHYVDDDRRMLASGKPLPEYVEPLPERNGKSAWCRTRKDLIHDANGKIVGVYGISVDITDAKELELDNQRLSEVVTDSNIFAFECDPATDTLYNVRYASVIGELPLVMPDFPESFIALYIHPSSADEYRRLYSDMKSGLPVSEGKIRYRFGDSETLMFVRMRNSFDADGKSVRIYGTARDLSLLTDLERQYHITLEQHGIFSWVIDVRNHVFSSSDFIRHNYASASNEGSKGALAYCADWGIHPDDYPVFEQAYHRMLAGERQIRNRIRRRNEATDTWGWMSFCWDGICDGNGNLSHIYISAVDINKQVESEERYAEFQSYQRMALKNVTSSIRLNLTQNTCFANVAKDEADATDNPFDTVDEFCSFVNQFVSDPEKRQEISAALSRSALLAAFAQGTTMLESELEYDYQSSGRRWTRSVVEMMENPYTHDVEALAYSIDIDQQHMLMQIVDRMVGMDYELLGVIDIETETVRFYKQSALETEAGTPQALHYPTGCAEFFQRIVPSEEQEKVTEINSLATIERELEKQALYTTSAKVVIHGTTSIKKWTYAYLDDQRAKIVYTRTDVTDIIESRQREQDELEQALLQAKQANNAKTEFLSRMSHDIRTPMNAIINITEFAFDDMANAEKLRDDLEKIKVSGTFLLGLINDILDMSRIESGKVVLKPVVYPVERFLNYLDSLIVPLFAAKNISFTIRPNNLLPAIYVDEVRFNQIFFNILSNAAKYTPEGGTVTFDVNILSHHSNIANAEFIVRDNGIGMSESFLQKAFSPFERESDVLAYTGTGLGLPITKALVEALGGSIRLESAQGTGTTVVITLTIPFLSTEELAESQLPASTPNTEHGRIAIHAGRILIAEHHPLNREVIVRLLNKQGFEATCANNGQEAVETMERAQADEYQLILMDVRMPVMDGISATKAIRALPDRVKASVPIIAMTADAFLEDRDRCLNAGMNDYLPKPIEPEKLRDMLLSYLGTQPANAKGTR